MKPSVLGLLRLAGALLTWALAIPFVHAQTAQPLVLGMVPQFPTVETQRRWQPMAQALEEACARPVELSISSSIPEFENRFLTGSFDLVYLNPYHMVMAAKAAGYVPLVRDGERLLRGILVVLNNSPAQKVQDLKGQTIALPAPNAFAGSLYMRALLEREFGIQTVAHYAKTHNNAYRLVITGNAAAAGGIKATLDQQVPAVRDQLRVLYETPGVPSHPLAIHPRVPAEDRDCIAKALTQAPPGSAMRQRLANVQMPTPIPAQYARDYLPLERLGLESYLVLN